MQNICPAISVVIPVYNVSLYLTRCLDSVVNQTFSDIEIIVVNDGSTDDSLSIIRQYMEKDKRIKLVDKKNEGLSYARKSGVEIATGTYIHHLDGDDYIEPDTYDVLYRKIQDTDADMLLFDFWFDHDIDGKLEPSAKHTCNNYTPIDFLNRILKNGGYFAVWSYLHKRAIYQNEINFTHEVMIGEDAYLTCQIAYYAKKIEVLDHSPLLHYIIRENSLSTAAITPTKINEMLLFPDLIFSFFSNKDVLGKLEIALASLKIQSFNNVIYIGYTKELRQMSKEAMSLYRKFPELKKYRTNKAFYKLYYAYSLNPFLGYWYGRYYKRKGKIKAQN
ncbi:MAG: glycosyltransferase family 2 protein [Bacteroidales bacterium]